MLVDTSVWVDHLRHHNQNLATLLDRGAVWCHPFVIGELACGNLQQRDQIIEALEALPWCTRAQHDEVLHWLRVHRLFGRGLGWVDVHLLCSAILSDLRLWTLDRSLQRVARELGVAAKVTGDGRA